MVAHNVILITDPNSDPDDLASFVVLADLAKQKKIEILSVVTTAGCYEIRLKRAKFAQGAFAELGLKNIRVAAGIDYLIKDDIHENNYCDNAYEEKLFFQSTQLEDNALELMVDSLEKSQDKTVTLLINAPMADAENLLNSAKDLCLKKLNQIVIMGGIEVEADENGIHLPANKSYNNKVCFQASKKVFEFAQKHNVRLVLVPKETVYEVQVSKKFYDDLAFGNNAIGQSMYLANRCFIEFLWKTVKKGDYSHFDVKRFLKVFMGNDYKIRSRKVTAQSSFEDIWNNIRYFNLYDVLSALAVIEDEFNGGYYERLHQDKNIFVAKVKDADILRGKMYEMFRIS